MKRMKTYTGIAALAAALALLVSACGGVAARAPWAPASGAPNANEQVSVSNVNGVGDVLVDAKGDALYMSEQEAGGMVLCTDGCTAFWKPLTAQGSGTPTGASSVDGTLGTVERPDGAQQVTFEGAPLYRFTEDSGPGRGLGRRVRRQLRRPAVHVARREAWRRHVEHPPRRAAASGTEPPHPAQCPAPAGLGAGARRSAGDVVRQVPDLEGPPLRRELHEVADRHEADDLSLLHHGQVPDAALRHQRHALVDRRLRRDDDRAAST